MANSKQIKHIYALPSNFFNEDGFIERFEKEILRMRLAIEVQEKDEIKSSMNAFFALCSMNAKNKYQKATITQANIQLLNIYAQNFDSLETAKNNINLISKREIKELLFVDERLRVKSSLSVAQAYVGCNNLMINSGNDGYDKIKIDYLLEAKRILLKLYNEHIKKGSLKKEELSDCLSILSYCVTQLSRWYEAKRYWDLNDNSGADYDIKAKILEAIKDKTCLNYNGILILEIIDSARIVKKESKNLLHLRSYKLFNSSAEELEKQNVKLLKKHCIKINDVKNHRKRYHKAFKNYSNYEQFALNKDLFINEHSLFCKCTNSIGDTLKIETAHEHTQIEWVKAFEEVLNVVTIDFTVARSNFYQSLNNKPLLGQNIQSIKRSNAKSDIQSALLKESFKMCYSILDKLVYPILNCMAVNHNTILNKEDKNRIYFLNMWEKHYGLITENEFNQNFYLISLYSIAKDLENTRKASLKDFKGIRNDLEHNILMVVEDNKNYQFDFKTINKKELIEKTELLLTLTKSAIMSFVYLVRSESILKHKTNKES